MPACSTAGASVTESPAEASRQAACALGSGVQPWGTRWGRPAGGGGPGRRPGPGAQLLAASPGPGAGRTPFVSEAASRVRELPQSSLRRRPCHPADTAGIIRKVGKQRLPCQGRRTCREGPSCGGGGALPLGAVPVCTWQHGGPQRDLPSGHAAEGLRHVPQATGTEPSPPQAPPLTTLNRAHSLQREGNRPAPPGRPWPRPHRLLP